MNANLDSLKAGPMPSQPTAKKCWELLQVGHNREQLLAGVRLLMDGPWATAATEQAHAMGALVKRLHHELGHKAIISRAMVGGFRKVLPMVGKQAAELARLQRCLVSNAAHVPDRITARHMFLGDAVQAGMAIVRRGKSNVVKRQHLIMKAHAQMFGKLSAGQLLEYERKAENRKSENIEKHQQTREEVLDQMCEVRKEQAEEQAKRKPLTLSSSRLDAVAVRRLHEGWTGFASSASQSHESRMADLCEAPPVIQQDRYESLAVAPFYELSWMSKPAAQRPAWLPDVVAHRKQFANSVWELQRGFDMKYYKFLLALQSPFQILFLPLINMDPLDAAPVTGSVDEDVLQLWDHRWMVETGEWRDWSELNFGEDVVVRVYTPCRHVGNEQVVSMDEPALLREFLDAQDPLPVKEPVAKRPREDGAKYTVTNAKKAKCPYMEEDLEDAALAACAEAAAEDKDEEDEHEGVLAMELPDRELTDAEKIALWTRLEGKRTEWDALAFGKVSARAFQVTFTKGEWTKRVKGVDYDFALGRAVGKPTKDWCKRYRMPDNARFSTLSYGGEHEATVLAQGWCSRMDHFLSIHTAAGDDAYRFTSDDADSWDPPPGWQAIYDSVPAGRKARVQDVFEKLPTS